MQSSKIEWCDHTFNPWIGCTKISVGCINCYAEGINNRFKGGNWGKGAPRRRTSEASWKQPLKWNQKAQNGLFVQCDRCGKREFRDFFKDGNCVQIGHCTSGGCHALPETESTVVRPRVFCGSMCDWLDDEVPIEWLVDLLELIYRTPNLDWLLLTKRPENWLVRIRQIRATWTKLEFDQKYSDLYWWLGDWISGAAPKNIWVGATVENDSQAEERIPLLRSIPASIRFLSCEPLLGEVELLIDSECSSWSCSECGSRNVNAGQESNDGYWWLCLDCGYQDFGDPNWTPDIHWVICGGESGPKAKPIHPEWVRSLRDQCKAAGVPFFFKQWGEWFPRDQWAHNPTLILPDDSDAYRNSDNTLVFSDELGRQYPVHRVGKKKAGRLLDGVEHNDFPKGGAA